METDIRRTGFCKEKNEKSTSWGYRKFRHRNITVYQRNTMTEQKTIAA